MFSAIQRSSAGSTGLTVATAGLLTAGALTGTVAALTVGLCDVNNALQANTVTAINNNTSGIGNTKTRPVLRLTGAANTDLTTSGTGVAVAGVLTVGGEYTTVGGEYTTVGC
jgi:hypothetical protein